MCAVFCRMANEMIIILTSIILLCLFYDNSDYFCWKTGGDGDNGEILAFVLDIYFEEQDAAREKGATWIFRR